MTGLDFDAWWDEPEYQACSTAALRAAFILAKLLELDAVTVRDTMKTWKLDDKPPEDITRVEWEFVLRAVGADRAAIPGVLMRLGRQWPDRADEALYARIEEILSRPNLHPADFNNVMHSVTGTLQMRGNHPLPPWVAAWPGIIRHCMKDPYFRSTVRDLDSADGTFGAWVRAVVESMKGEEGTA